MDARPCCTKHQFIFLEKIFNLYFARGHKWVMKLHLFFWVNYSAPFEVLHVPMNSFLLYGQKVGIWDRATTPTLRSTEVSGLLTGNQHHSSPSVDASLSLSCWKLEKASVASRPSASEEWGRVAWSQMPPLLAAEEKKLWGHRDTKWSDLWKQGDSSDEKTAPPITTRL